jgi:hypothetical protein
MNIKLKEKNMNTLLKSDLFLKINKNSKEIFNKKPEYKDLPTGSYICYIRDMELAISKQGNLMIKTVFEVKEGKFKGKLESDYLTFAPAYIESKLKLFYKRAEVLGLIDSDQNDLENIVKKFPKIIGAVVLLSLELVTSKNGIQRRRLSFTPFDIEEVI